MTIRDDFNVSSITDNGTGDYTINFASALSSANYAIVGSAGGGGANVNPRIVGPSQANPTTTNLRITVVEDAGNLDDMAYVSVAIFI